MGKAFFKKVYLVTSGVHRLPCLFPRQLLTQESFKLHPHGWAAEELKHRTPFRGHRCGRRSYFINPVINLMMFFFIIIFWCFYDLCQFSINLRPPAVAIIGPILDRAFHPIGPLLSQPDYT